MADSDNSIPLSDSKVFSFGPMTGSALVIAGALTAADEPHDDEYSLRLPPARAAFAELLRRAHVALANVNRLMLIAGDLDLDDPGLENAEEQADQADDEFLDLAHAVLETPALDVAMAVAKMRYGLAVDPEHAGAAEGADPAYGVMAYVLAALKDLDRIAARAR